MICCTRYMYIDLTRERENVIESNLLVTNKREYQQFNKIVEDKDALNTKRQTKQAVRLFHKYLLEKEVDTEF